MVRARDRNPVSGRTETATAMVLPSELQAIAVAFDRSAMDSGFLCFVAMFQNSTVLSRVETAMVVLSTKAMCPAEATSRVAERTLLSMSMMTMPRRPSEATRKRLSELKTPPMTRSTG